MATYTAPTTRTTGALISASIWNTDIVENLKYFKDAPVFDGAVKVTGALTPNTNDGSALGSATVSWADLFLASGGVINFNNGDVTVTHSTNTLTFAGAASGYVFNDGNLVVDTNTLYVDATNNRVGIGTTSPSFPLHAMTTGTGTTAAANAVARFASNGTGYDVFCQFSDTVTNSGGIGMLSGNMYIHAGGAERMRIDTSGNFYVGTTSQSGGSNITFNQPTNADMKIAALASTGTRAAYQVFVSNTVTTVGTENSTGGSLASGTAAYATVLANNSAYPIGFATNNTERLRITSGGNVAIGATARFYFDGVAGTGDTYMYEIVANNIRVVAGGNNIASFGVAGGTGAEFYGPVAVDAAQKLYLDGGVDTYFQEVSGNVVNLYAGGTARFQVASGAISTFGTVGVGVYSSGSGTSTGTAIVRNGTDGQWYLTSSSRRFKENISTAVVTDAQLDAFMATAPSWWDYKGQKNGALGFIAEDLAALPLERYGCNPLVNYDAEGQIESNRDYALIAMHHLVIQRLERKIAALEARIH